MYALLLALCVSVSSSGATCPLPSRNMHQVYEFRKTHPCPITGQTTGACPGWEVDHVVPLACCGKDHPDNMRWLEHDLHKLRHQKGLNCSAFNQNVLIYRKP